MGDEVEMEEEDRRQSDDRWNYMENYYEEWMEEEDRRQSDDRWNYMENYYEEWEEYFL